MENKEKEVLRVLLRHYTKIGRNGGISKVIFDDEFEEIASEIVKLFDIQPISKFKTMLSEGDKVIVEDCIYGHGFKIGEEIKILKVRERDYLAGSDAGEWYIQDIEIRLIK